MTTAVLDRELQRLEGLWADGLSETYRSYLDAVAMHAPDVQPRVALAAALVEVGLRLQGLGGPAAPPAALSPNATCCPLLSRVRGSING